MQALRFDDPSGHLQLVGSGAGGEGLGTGAEPDLRRLLLLLFAVSLLLLLLTDGSTGSSSPSNDARELPFFLLRLAMPLPSRVPTTSVSLPRITVGSSARQSKHRKTNVRIVTPGWGSGKRKS